MNRSEYINTRRGQSREYFKRYSDRVLITINQEPKSKNGINKEEKFEFRNLVHKQLNKLKRRAFRKDILLQIDFYTTEHNPPSVQNLVKNYLDLLHKKMPEIDDKKCILFKDDDQVKLLIANIYLNENGINEPKIQIKGYRYNHFLKDLELVERIKGNSFEPDEFYDDIFKKPELYESYKNATLFEDWQVEIDSSTSIKKYGIDLSKLIEEFKIRRIQQLRLKENNLMLDEVVHLIDSKKDKTEVESKVKFELIDKILKKLIFISKDSIEIGESPTLKGQKKIFKDRMEKLLKHFRENNPDLVPLYAPLGIIVLFLPPKNNMLDLDNLAKYIIPITTDIFNPPTIINKLKYKLKLENKFLEEEIELSQKIPKHGIMRYQIIKIDREKDSPENGSINLILTDGMLMSNNVWWKVDKYIYDWKL